MTRGPARPVRSAVAGAALVVACFAAGAGAPACTYPDFQFGDEDGGGGEGGGPASSSTGPTGPQVHCHDPPVLCAVNQACCLHEIDPAQDVCADAGQCGPQYNELRCNDSADCPPTAPICCAKDDNGDGFPDGIGCQATCDAIYETPMCTAPEDCDPPRECKALIVGYDGYDACLP